MTRRQNLMQWFHIANKKYIFYHFKKKDCFACFWFLTCLQPIYYAGCVLPSEILIVDLCTTIPFISSFSPRLTHLSIFTYKYKRQSTVVNSRRQTTRQAGRSRVRIAASAKILQQKNKQKRIRMKCITSWKKQRDNLTLPLHGFQNFQENLFYFTQAGRKRDVMPSIFLHATFFLRNLIGKGKFNCKKHLSRKTDLESRFFWGSFTTPFLQCILIIWTNWQKIRFLLVNLF